MKLVLGAAVAALLLVSPALAQSDTAPASSSCGAIAPPPDLPDGAGANYEEMETANARYTEWAASNRQVLECRRAEVEALRARYEALRVEFNAGAEQARATQTSWEAEVAEFNARNPRSRTR
jgi:hypothetical protein